MTGYGSAAGPLGGGQVALSVRSVNHRHLQVQVRLPNDLEKLDPVVRERCRRQLARGYVTVSVEWTEPPPVVEEVQVDLERARAWAAALRELQRTLDLAGGVDVGLLARQPEVFKVRRSRGGDVEAGEFVALLDAALAELKTARAREGQALTAALDAQLAELGQWVDAVEKRAPERLAAERERLRRAVGELLGAPAPGERMEVEIAVLATRLDVAEELVRLRTHLAAARSALRSEGAVGRRLAFLGQEMLREVNTIGSKANDTVMAQAVIAMKERLEQFREQVENLE